MAGALHYRENRPDLDPAGQGVPVPRRPSLFRLEPFGEYEDPDAAPAAFAGSDPAPRWTLRRARQNHVSMYLFGLVFMIFPVITVLQQARSAGGLALGLGQVLALTVLYAGVALVVDTRLRVRYLYLVLFVAVVASTAVVVGLDFTGYGVYVAILTAALIPWRVSRVLVLVWSAALLLLGLVTMQWTPTFIALIAVGLGWAVGSGMEQSRVGDKLHRVEVRAAELAVVAERERIARDLHDILGHSLTAVSIKAGLAGRLVGVDDEGARHQVAEVEAIARQALADVRATASAMRQVRLATEIASARSVLEAAGITAETPSALGALPEAVSELLGYVVREAVTNVVRHSRATRCVISAGDGAVTVADDGRGLPGSAPGRDRGLAGPAPGGSGPAGSGLAGLRQRIEAGGGTLQVGTGLDGAGVAVHAALPAGACAAPAPTGASPTRSTGPDRPGTPERLALPGAGGTIAAGRS